MSLSRNKKIRISLFSAAFGVWLLGFADLIRGGTTLSALLLATAYCVLIPAAIWHRGASPADKRNAAPRSERPSYWIAAGVGATVLALYVATMAPSTAMWDTSEYIAAAYSFGLPHPPGNPFFVIVGHLFALLPIAPNVAARVNLLAAFASAAAAGLWFLVTEQVLRAWVEARWLRIVSAISAALIGATAFTVWNQSVVNEKVYTVSLAGIALVSWLAVRWSADPATAHSDRYLVLIAYLCGLGYANHMAGMLPAPAVALAVLVHRPSALVRWRLLLACIVALFVGVTPFATQPIRAGYFPALDEGEPTGCRETFAMSCTISKATLNAFEYNLNRVQYGKPNLSDRQATFGQQVGMWWLYFQWQWLRDPNGAWPFAQALLAATFLVAGFVGAWTHAERDRATFWYFGALMFTVTLLLIYYLNFKLGWSQDPGSQAPREVRDRDYFFLWSFSAWGVWVAVGLLRVAEWTGELAGRGARNARSIAAPSARAWRYTSSVFVLSLIPLLCNWTSASRARHRATRDMAADLLNSVEPYGVLVTVGDNDTFPLWYAQEVEGIRRDVVVANTSLLNTDWYVRQLIRRPVYGYDAARGPAIYRDERWTKPSRAPINMTLADADAVPPYYELPKPVRFDSGPLHTTIDPKHLEYGVLQRADAFVLRMIQDSWPARPIYFARSAVGYPQALGLGDNVLTQGLAWKLFMPPLAQARDTLLVEGDGWLDIPRTHALWSTVFQGPAAVLGEGQWVDRASLSMPAMYVFTGAELAEGLRAMDSTRAAAAVFDTTERLAQFTHIESLLSGVERDIAQPAAGDSAGVPLRIDAGRQPKTPSSDPASRRRPATPPR